MDETKRAADTVAATMAWAVRRAKTPAYTDFEADGTTVTFRCNFTDRKFRFTVEEVR